MIYSIVLADTSVCQTFHGDMMLVVALLITAQAFGGEPGVLPWHEKIWAEHLKRTEGAQPITGSRDGDLAFSEKLDEAEAEARHLCRQTSGREQVLKLKLREIQASIAEGGPAWLRAKLMDDYTADDERAFELLKAKLAELRAEEKPLLAELVAVQAKEEVRYRQCVAADLLRELSYNLVIRDNKRGPETHPEMYLACGLTAESGADRMIDLGLRNLDCTNDGHTWDVSSCSCRIAVNN